MKGLLIKDLKIIANQYKLFIMAIVFGCLLSWANNDVTFAATYIILLLSMITLTTISYDDFNGGMLFLLSLPTDRKTYVKEKYIFAFLNLVCSSLISLIVCYSIALIKGIDVKFESLITTIMGTAMAMGIMLGLSIPLEFKFGVEKGRVAMIIAVAAMAIVGMGGYKLLTDVLDIDIKAKLLIFISKLPASGLALDALIVGSLLAVLLIILFISYIVAYKIMKKKEY